MAVTDFSQVRWGDPEVEVLVTYKGEKWAGFVDARRRRDDVWEAWVTYSPIGPDGLPHRRRDWFTYDELELQGRAE